VNVPTELERAGDFFEGVHALFEFADLANAARQVFAACDGLEVEEIAAGIDGLVVLLPCRLGVVVCELAEFEQFAFGILECVLARKSPVDLGGSAVGVFVEGVEVVGDVAAYAFAALLLLVEELPEGGAWRGVEAIHEAGGGHERRGDGESAAGEDGGGADEDVHGGEAVEFAFLRAGKAEAGAFAEVGVVDGALIDELREALLVQVTIDGVADEEGGEQCDGGGEERRAVELLDGRSDGDVGAEDDDQHEADSDEDVHGEAPLCCGSAVAWKAGCREHRRRGGRDGGGGEMREEIGD